MEEKKMYKKKQKQLLRNSNIYLMFVCRKNVTKQKDQKRETKEK